MVKTISYNISNMRRDQWNEDEDETRISNWKMSPKKAGLKRCGKSCRVRHTNNQKNDERHESFTPEEEELIIRLHQAIGSRWPIIAQQLPGRTENEVKNYWNTKARKKLTGMGIDHVTHRPFSQLLADYGNMSGNPCRGRRIGPLDRELKNAFVYHTEQGIIDPQGNFPHQDTSSSHDLLTQLQTITLVTEASKTSNDAINIMQNDYSSSSSTSSSSFSWRDFLIEDPSLLCDEGKNEILLDGESMQKDKQVFEAVGERGFEAPSSSDSSFIEAMVERQNEMLMDFPEFLEDSFFY